MAINQTFTDFVTPIPADWLNNVNTIVNGIPNPINATTIPFTSTAPGGVARHVSDHLNDDPSITDVGGNGSGVVDNSTVLQAVLNNTTNLAYTIPVGIYKFGTALTSDYTTITQAIGSPSIRASLQGTSMSNTLLRYSGTGYAITLKANLVGQGLNSYDYYSNFLLEDNAQANSNSGLYIQNRALFRLSNVGIFYMINGCALDASYTGYFDNCAFNLNQNGLVFAQTSGEAPNLMNFKGCKFDNNSLTAITGNINASIYFDGCDFENNGTQGNAATGAVVMNIVSPLSGPLEFNNCYFEINSGSADINITNTSGAPATIIVQNCTFNRGLVGTWVTNNIRVSNSGAGSVTKLIMIGNAFNSVNGYVPSVSRLFINSDTNTEVIDLGNSYNETTSLTYQVTHGRSMGGLVAANGGITTAPPQISVTHTSTGNYAVVHNSGFGKDALSYIATAVSQDTNPTIVQRVVQVSGTQFNVVTVNTSNAATDAPFAFNVLQLGK